MNLTKILTDIFIIAGALMIPVSFIVLWYKQNKILKRLDMPVNVSKHKSTIESKQKNIYCNAELQRIILALRHELRCAHICLNRFHNGGFFANGLDMEKFSQTHETPYKVPLMQNCQAVLNSKYSLAFELLHVLHEYSVVDTADCKDQNFKNDMEFYGFKSTYLFLIQQADGSDEGFIGVNYTIQHAMTAEQKGIVKSSIPHIRDLMNLKEGILNLRKD